MSTVAEARLSVYLTPVLREAILKVASAEGATASTVIRRAVIRELERCGVQAPKVRVGVRTREEAR